MLPILILCAVSVFIVVILVTAIAHIRVATPYGGTPKNVAEAMIHLAAIREGETVCDIGAGDGRLLIAAKRQCPGIKAIGYEVALGIWLLGKLRIAFSGQDVTLRYRNALHEDLSKIDVLFLYVGPFMMRKLLPKLQRELRPGTRVVSHVFRFPGLAITQEERVARGRGSKGVYLYQWGDAAGGE